MHSCDRHNLRSIGWWVGKSSATRLQPAILWKERLWIPAPLPDLVTTFLLAEVAHLQQNSLVSTEWHCDQWEIFFGLPSGPLLTELNEHMWQHMD